MTPGSHVWPIVAVLLFCVQVPAYAATCSYAGVPLPEHAAKHGAAGEIGTGEFEIIAINVDKNTEDGLKFLADHPVSYPVFADPDGWIGIPYGIRSLPHSFLLNRKGNIVATHRSFKAGDEVKLKQAITRLLEQ